MPSPTQIVAVPYRVPRSRPSFVPWEKHPLHRAFHLAQSAQAIWMPSGGTFRDFGRKGLTSGAHDAAFQTSLVTLKGSEGGIAAHCAPTNATIIGQCAYGRVAPGNTDFDNTSGSVEAWIWISQAPGSAADNPSIISRHDVSTGRNGITMYIHFISAGVFELAGLTRNNAGTSTNINSGTANLSIGRWTHVAFTWASAGTCYIYVDGRLVSSTGSAVTFTFNAQDIFIGADALVGSGFFTGFQGYIAKAAWYSVQLSDNEVYRLSRSPRVGFDVQDSLMFTAPGSGGTPVQVDYADNVSWADVDALQPQVNDSLLLSDAFIAGSPASVVSVTMTDSISWSPDQREDQRIDDSLGWSGQQTGDFTLTNVYDADGDELIFSDRFVSDVGELANGRYRR